MQDPLMPQALTLPAFTICQTRQAQLGDTYNNNNNASMKLLENVKFDSVYAFRSIFRLTKHANRI